MILRTVRADRIERAIEEARLRLAHSSSQSPLYDKMKLKARSHLTKMPVNKSLYPDNWKELAWAVKNSQNWCCECCGKKCYRPGERPEGLTRSEWTANILQVHHRNHDTSDNRLSNLMSVCAACHLGLHRSRYSPVSEGQLKLF